MTKTQIIAAGFALFGATRLHRVAARWTRGCGAILMFHHVRPWSGEAFAPNRLLEITPAFLDLTIRQVRSAGFEILTLDAALSAMDDPSRTTPFAVLTFDDGYRDLVQHALPVLEHHRAPFTSYITTAFAGGIGRLWWLELEAAIRNAAVLPGSLTGLDRDLPANDLAAKLRAFTTLYPHLRALPEDEMLARIADLCAHAGVAIDGLSRELCLDWAGIEQLAMHPLCTIGAHTITHPMLAKLGEAEAAGEIRESRRRLEERLRRPVRHFAYPVGDRSVAGAREFRLAEAAGYASAVTTRPGMIFPAHRAMPTALPRLSINGCWQRQDVLDVLLSGAAFTAWNRGRRWEDLRAA